MAEEKTKRRKTKRGKKKANGSGAGFSPIFTWLTNQRDRCEIACLTVFADNENGEVKVMYLINEKQRFISRD
jgi:predicted metal-dependent peptidase